MQQHVYAQDISLTKITPSETSICRGSELSLELEITVDGKVDLRTQSITIYMEGANQLSSRQLTIPNTSQYDLSGAGTVTVTIPDDFTSQISSLTFTNIGSSTFTASLTVPSSVASDTDTTNDFIQIGLDVLQTSTPTISTSVGGFTICKDATVTFTASGGFTGDTYYWKFGTVSATISGDTVTKAPGELTNGEIVQLYTVSSDGCTSTIVDEVISLVDPPTVTASTTLPGNTLCAGDDFELTLNHTDYSSGTTTFTVVYGSNTLELSTTTGVVTRTITGITAETVFTITTENGDGCSATDSITVYVPELDLAGEISTAATTTICSGDVLAGAITSVSTATFASGSSTATIEYEWQFLSTTTPTWVQIPGSGNTSDLATATLAAFPIYEDIEIRRVARAVRGSVQCDDSAATPSISIDVEPITIPTLSSSLGTFAVCENQAIEITAVGAPTDYTYRWYLNSSLVSSDTTLSYTINPGDITANATIGLEVVNTAGCTSTLISQAITFNSEPTVTASTTLPGNTLCAGDDFELTLNHTDYSSGTTTFTVVYGSNTLELSTTTGVVTRTITGITAETVFTITTENGDGCSATDSITVYVPELDLAGEISTAATTTICSGDVLAGAITSVSTATFASGSSTATIEYEWQFLSTTTPTWVQIPGSGNTSDLATATLAAFPIYEDIEIRRVARAVRGSVQCDDSAATPSISIDVEPITIPTLSSSLGTFAVCENQAIEITAVGAPTDYTYRWYLNSSLVSSDTTLSYTINPGDITANATIGLEVVNTAGCTSTLISQAITFNSEPTVTASTTLPGNTLCAGDDFELTLNHTDYSSGTTTFTVVYGSNTFELSTTTGVVTRTITGITAETVFTITTENGDGCSATDSITVYVPELDLAGEISTAATTTICSGDVLAGAITSVSTATFASGSSTATIEYEWQFLSTTTPTWVQIPGSGNTSDLATATLAAFPIYEDIEIRRVARAVRGSVQCDDSAATPSISIDVEPITIPTLSSSLGTFAVCENQAIEITAVGAPTDYTYRWYLNSSLVSSDTTLSYTINPGDITANATIGLEVVNTAGCTSTLISQAITFNSEPTVTASTTLPGNTLCAGDDFELTLNHTDYSSGTTTFTVVYGSNTFELSTTTGVVTRTITGITAETVFTITTENGDGCSATDSITVYVPELDLAGEISTAATTTICSGDVLAGAITSVSTATFASGSSTATIEYEWQFLSTTTPTWVQIPGSGNTSDLATATLAAFPIYEDIQIRRVARAVRGSAQCEFVGVMPQIAVSIGNVRTPSITEDPSNLYCNGEDVIFNGSGLLVGDSYELRLNGTTIASGTATQPSVSFTITSTLSTVGINNLEFDISAPSASCSNTATTSYTVVALPVISIDSNSSNDTFCADETVIITATGATGGRFSWQYGSSVADTTVPELRFSSNSLNATDTTIILTYTNTSTLCSSVVTMTVSKIEVQGTDTVTATRTTYCIDERPNSITGVTSRTSSNSSVSFNYFWEATTNPIPDFTSNAVSITSNTEDLSFSSPLSEPTWFRRASVAELNGQECIYYSDPLQILIENIDGGTITPAVVYTCDLSGGSYTVTVSDTSFGPTLEYQWQSSSSNSSATFTNVSGASSETLQISLNVSQTTYYRRITRSSDPTNSCATVEYSNVFTLYVNTVEPGTLTDYSGNYCFGSTPPDLGVSSVVTSTFPIYYQWYRAETDDLTTVTQSSWVTVTGETNNSLNTPPLDSQNRYVLYRRGVYADDGSGTPCWSYTDNIVFEINDELDAGYVDIRTGTPDFPYCIGDTFPDLRLISADNRLQASNNNIYTDIITTWQLSRDGISWSDISDNDTDKTTFYLNNSRSIASRTPGNAFYMDDDIFIRVKIEEGGGVVSSTHDSGVSILLDPTDASESISVGETYSITVGTNTVSVTVSAVNSTTDLIGADLEALIDGPSIPNYTATYNPSSNILTLEDQLSQQLEVSSRIYYTTTQSLFMTVFEQTNGNANCVYYTAAYMIDVEARPELNIAGGASNQQVCLGTPMTPIGLTWTGAFETFNISGLDASISIGAGTGTITVISASEVYISGTNSITLTGSPTSQVNLVFTLESTCESGDVIQNYTINVISDPPPITNIFRDSEQNRRATVFETGGRNYNNTVCVDSTVPISDTASLTTSEFWVCIDGNNPALNRLEWQFIDRDGIGTISPSLSTTALYDTNESGKQEGISVVWDPSFVASVTTGAWVKMRVRSISTCSSTITSSWYEQDLWIVRTDQASQTLAQLDLPTLAKPEALDLVFCGYDSNPAPSCERFNSGDQSYTQFFTAADTGTNNFGTIEWAIDPPSAGTIASDGYVTWTVGFSGDVIVSARPLSCDSDSPGDWVDSDVITIGEIIDQFPQITPTGLPTCPIPSTGTHSITLEADIAVDWYIESSSKALIDTSVVTITSGSTFRGYEQIDSNFGTEDLELTWQNDAEGTLRLYVVPQGCGGETMFTRYDVVIPTDPQIVRLNTSDNGAINQQICESDLNFDTITYDIIGRSVTGVEIVDSTVSSTLGSYVNYQIETRSQSITFTLAGNNDANKKSIWITINGNWFKILLDRNETTDSAGSRLQNLIDSSPDLNATYNASSNELVVTGEPGYYMDQISAWPDSTTSNIVYFDFDFDRDEDVVYNRLHLSNLNTNLPAGVYDFQLNLILDEGCEQNGNPIFTLEVNPDTEIVFDDPSTQNQTICYNESIDSITLLASGLDATSDLYIDGVIPSNIIQSYTKGSTTATFTLTSSGVPSDYWNTRNFNFNVVSDGDECVDDSQALTLTIYPQDFLRRVDLTNTQTICDGEAITPIEYEFWGIDGLSTTLQDLNSLGLTTSITTRTQVVSLTFQSVTGSTQTNTIEDYFVFVNDTSYLYSTTSATIVSPTIILQGLRTAMASSSIVTSTIQNNALVITALSSGTTISIEGRSGATTSFNFVAPYMVTAPNLLTITGTPTVTIPNTSDVGSYDFDIITTGGNYCGGISAAASETYTLNVTGQSVVELTSADRDLVVCDGTQLDNFIFEAYRTSAITISAQTASGTAYPGLDPPLTLNRLPGASTISLTWTPNNQIGLTSIATYTYTVTATANACGETDVVTGTLTVVPHYITRNTAMGNASQTLCVGTAIDPIEYSYSSDHSSYNVYWGGGVNPGLTFTPSGTLLTLSGTASPSGTLSRTTTYSYTIEIESNYDTGNNCFTKQVTGTITITPESKIELTSASNTLNQEWCDGETIDDITLMYSQGATNYNITWVPGPPTGITASPLPGTLSPATSTVTLSGTLNTGVTETTVYYYTITTVGNTNSCSEDTIEGSIVIHPNTALDRLERQEPATITTEDGLYIDLSYEFEGIPELTVTSSTTLDDLNLLVNTTYLTTPTVELTVVASATAIGEIFQVEIVEEGGGSRSYRFRSTTGAESPTAIATALTSRINTDIDVSATASGTSIIITADNPNYVFWTRINSAGVAGTVVHDNQAKIKVTDVIPVLGSLSVTGTPTLGNNTTVSYTLEIETVSLRCTAVSATTVIIIDPTEFITPIVPDLSFELMDGSNVNSPTFELGGAATSYAISWTGASPPNLQFLPAPGALGGTSTVTLSGNLDTGIDTTTVYYYTVTTLGPGAVPATVTGTIVVYPNDPDVLLNPSQNSSQNYCDANYVDLSYAFSGIPELTVTSTSTLSALGLATTLTYTTSPSVELTVVASATQAGEYFQIEIVEEDGGSRTYSYSAPLGTESETTIAEALRQLIDADPEVTATRTGTAITIAADYPNYVFWVRINVGNTVGTIAHINESKMQVTDATQVAGILSLTGTPTLGNKTTVTHTLEIETNSDRSDTVTASTVLTFRPDQFIDVTDTNDLDLQFCDGTAVSSPTFVLSGSATGYSVNWTPAIPNGLTLSPAAAGNLSGQQTLTLAGTLDTGVTTTTVYTYVITTAGTSCDVATISGTITVLPKHYITLTSGTANQEICNINEPIIPIEYTLDGGAITYNVSWSGGPIGLNVINTSSNTLTISGTVNIPGLTTTTSYTYTIETIGNNCQTDTVSGVITVIPQLDYQIDTPTTRNQTGANVLCNQEAIQDIVFTVIGGEGASQVSLTWTTANELQNVTVTPDATNTTWTISGITNDVVNVLTSYPYQISIYRPGTCVDPVSFSGTIQIVPNPQVDQEFIQDNDVMDVSCEGGTDGSIIIPITPTSEFEKRILGGQLSQKQVDAVTLVASQTLSVGEVVRVEIDGFTFEATVGTGHVTATVLQSLADQINFGLNANSVDVLASVISTTTPPELRITADTAGAAFSTSSVTLTSATNSITTVVSNVILNESINYTFDWYDSNDNLIHSGSTSLTNLQAGTYKLAVSVNGCTTSPTTYEFVVEEPSITVGTVSETCDGAITVPISAYFTPTQLNQVGETLRVELFERDVNNAFTVSYDFDSFTATTASNTWEAQFVGLSPGETYQLVVTDNTCASRITSIVGPISEEVSINEVLLTAADEECAGQGGTLTVETNAINGGSGFFDYQWTGPTTYNTKNVTGATPGTYILTVTDRLLGCMATTVGTVTIGAADGLTLVRADTSVNIANECIDGRDGELEVLVSGGDGINYSYRWEFTPSTTSTTITLNNDAAILIPDNELPSGLSSTGAYTVFVYDGSFDDGCPPQSTNFTITGPTAMEFVSDPITTDITCAGDETGTIDFEVSGGTPPYFYSITGGTPSNQINTGSESISNLAAGTYNLVIIDSTPDSCTTANRLEQTITITEPEGGPLELTESSVNPIPCQGGRGSFVIGVTGGAAAVQSGTLDPDTKYQVRVVGPGANYVLNTSHTRSQPSFTVENLTLVGEYTVTVTDANGCSQSINVTVDNSANENLGATAIIEAASGCNDTSLSEGAKISITQFDRGDGDIAGYPLWQKRTAIDLDQITIAFSGTIGDLPASIGVLLDGNVIDATSTTSITTIQDIAAIINSKINNLSGYAATLLGSSIRVRAEIIDTAESLTASLTSLNISISNVSRVSENTWVEVPGLAGLEIVENLQAGFYRAIIQDGSGCGATLVQNQTQGGTIFRIDDPQGLQLENIEFDEITCDDDTTTLTFNLSNGVYELLPETSVYELTLNSIRLNNAAGGVTGVTQGSSTSSSTTTTSSSTQQVSGNSYTINTNSNKYIIPNLGFNSYELSVRNLQTDCIAVLNFTVEEPASITYSGETEFIIDPCYDSFQDIFFDNALIEGGVPFTTSDGEAYYFLKWVFYPKSGGNAQTINSLSNNVQFNPLEGRYELFITDKNGCTPQNEDGTPVAFEFNFVKELSNLSVIGAANGSNEFAVPVSCEGGGEDGQISIDVVSADPDNGIPPYEIRWEREGTNNLNSQQKLLIEGVRAGDSLEVYSIKLNEIVFSYVTQEQNEPKESVLNELVQIIDQSALFNATVDATANENEIIISTASNASLELEIISTATVLRLINSSSSQVNWIPLDGTNGNPNYSGYLSLNGLTKGNYRYSITAVNLANCSNPQQAQSLTGIIEVLDNNILELRDGPYIDSFLCNAQPGTMFLDVFAGNTGPLRFVYNGASVSFDQVGNSQYELYIDAPVAEAQLEIYNADDCNITRTIKLGNGNPLFNVDSISFEQQGSFVAREEITFEDNSENDYDSFEFIFGDGTKSDRIVRDSPEPIIHTYGISGTYFVTLNIYNDLGCVESLTKPVVVGKGFSIQVPNAFSPNGDGINDTFKPKFNGLGLVELSVYDYRGNLLYFESAPEDGTPIDPDSYTQPLDIIGWDGQTTIDSPYFIYSIRGVTLFDQKEVERSGTFIMLK